MLGTNIALLDAPSNLGLRPPGPGITPGCAKLAGALRDQNLFTRLKAREAGVLTPPRYLPDWAMGEGPRNAEAIALYSRKLADRIETLLAEGAFPLVLGGDCSIALGPLLALKRRGRFGLAYFDAHTDFRHLGNSESLQAVGGEDVAVASGRGCSKLTDLQGLGPSLRLEDVAYVGVRDDAWFLDEVRNLGAQAVTSGSIRKFGAARAGAVALGALEPLDGFWVHVDCDVLDGALMPAVDSPEPDGLDYSELAASLRVLVSSPKAVGAQITIFDPDLDPDGRYAAQIADCVAAAFAQDDADESAIPR
jgi:arginase